MGIRRNEFSRVEVVGCSNGAKTYLVEDIFLFGALMLMRNVCVAKIEISGM